MSLTRRSLLKALFVGAALALPAARITLQDIPRRLNTGKRVAYITDPEYGGPIGDDWTQAIQYALDDMAEVSGTVIFPAGDYRTTAPLIVEGDGVKIIGQGGGISYEGDSGGAIEMSGGNHMVCNMSVKASGKDANCLRIHHTQGAMMHSCVFSSREDEPYFIPQPSFQQKPLAAQIRELSA